MTARVHHSAIVVRDPKRADAGIVELVQFGNGDAGRVDAPAGRTATAPGFFLISCYVDPDGVLVELIGVPSA